MYNNDSDGKKKNSLLFFPFFLLFSFVPSVGNGPTCYSYNHSYSYDNDGEFCLFVYVLMLE